MTLTQHLTFIAAAVVITAVIITAFVLAFSKARQWVQR